eukprot:1594228-Karenia_brevis.AAC.1
MVERDGSQLTEVILDVVSSHPGSFIKTMVVVTIRAPHASIYADADKVVGIAAKGGQTDKLERYGAQ